MKILAVFPLVRTDEEVAERVADYPADLFAAGTQVDYRSVRFSGTAADSYYDLMMVDLGVIELALAAEDEGYDAVCVGSCGDPGLGVLRSRLSIPVVGPGIVAAHIASMLGNRLGIVTTTLDWTFFVERNLRLYGLRDKLVSIRDAGMDWSREGYYADETGKKTAKVIEAARAAVEIDGADCLMTASTSMHPTIRPMQEALPGIPVIDPHLWSLKIAECLVTLGVSHSKKAYQSSKWQHDAAVHRIAETLPGYPVRPLQ